MNLSLSDSELRALERADDLRRLLAYVGLNRTMYHRPTFICSDETFRAALKKGLLAHPPRDPGDRATAAMRGYVLTETGENKYRELLPGMHD